MQIEFSAIDFSRLFEIFPGLCIVVLPDMTVAAVTNEYLRATNVRRDDLVGHNLFDLFPENPADPEAHGMANIRASVEKVFRTGEIDELPIQKYDVRQPAAAGGGFEERYWRIMTFPGAQISAAGETENDSIPYVMHRVEDITEQIRLERKEAEHAQINAELKRQTTRIELRRQQMEEALEDAQLRLESALDAGEIGTWTWDVVNNRVVADKSLAKFFSVSAADANGGEVERYTAAMHPDDRGRVEKLIGEALQNDDSYEAEYRLLSPENSIRWVVARGRILRDETGRPMQLPGVVIDITERKRTEEYLRESNERFQLISSATNDAIWDWDLQSNDVWWNKALRTMFGYREEQIELTAQWWYEHIHLEDRDRVVSSIHQVIDNGGENWSDEYRFLCADGSFKYILDRGFAIHRDNRPIRMLGAMQDVTARRQAEADLRKSQERLQLVLDTSILGLWYCDLPFDVLNWSSQTKEHFWLPSEANVTIEDFYNIIHKEDRENTRAAIDASIINRTHYDVEYRTVNQQNNHFKWIRAIGRGFYDENDNPYRFDGITIDISDDKLVQSERERLLWNEKDARAEAENANRLKDEFLATLSHELRTPLTSILGWSRMLKEKQVAGEQAERAIDAIERNARAQAQLIEDVLDVSRIISGKMRLEVTTVNLATVIEAAIDAVRPAAEAKNIRLQRIIDSDAMISGDEARLQQIIWNLLSNAIKFTPKNGRVQIKLERINSHVEIIVSDNGIGIEAEMLPFVFERFRQSDSSTTRQHGGLGLGLAIVRHLVELHGGTVRAVSEGTNQGATFTVTFPIISVRSREVSVKTDETGQTKFTAGNLSFSCPQQLESLRVLLVDDEPDTREILTFIFETCQAKITSVASADEALQALANNKFDVLVSDIGMPNRDGYQLIKAIRQLPPEQGGRIPAVALTAYARVEDRMKVLAAGFQMHVPKPVEPSELIAVIVSLIDRNNF